MIAERAIISACEKQSGRLSRRDIRVLPIGYRPGSLPKLDFEESQLTVAF